MSKLIGGCHQGNSQGLSSGKLTGFVEEKNGVGDAESSGSVQPGEGKVKGVGVGLIAVLSPLIAEGRQEVDSLLEAPRDKGSR